MSTTARTQANRRNAQRSTGPKTTAGKAIAAGNARRHGLLSRELILPGEAREDFELLLEELQRDWQPDGITENLLVERIAVALWRQQRIIRAETAEIHLQQQAADPPFIATDEHSYDIALENAFRLERLRWDYLPIREHLLATHSIPRGIERLTRYQAALDNDLYKALRELRTQQSFRRSRNEVVIPSEDQPSTEPAQLKKEQLP